MPEDDKDNNKGQEGLQSLLSKFNNDWAALAGELYSQTGRLREDRRNLREEVEDLKKKLPNDDSVVLSKADAERWKSYQELGSVDKVKERLEERDKLEKDLKVTALEAMVEKAGYRLAKLQKFLPADALGYDTKKEGENEVVKLFLTVEDKKVSLEDYAKQEDVEDLLNVARLNGKTEDTKQSQRSGVFGVGHERDKAKTSSWKSRADKVFTSKEKRSG